MYLYVYLKSGQTMKIPMSHHGAQRAVDTFNAETSDHFHCPGGFVVVKANVTGLMVFSETSYLPPEDQFWLANVEFVKEHKDCHKKPMDGDEWKTGGEDLS